jgi:CubicO group peptidase (beta-lactamase class C family)
MSPRDPNDGVRDATRAPGANLDRRTQPRPDADALAALARAHQMQPPHLAGVQADRGRDDGLPALRAATLEAPRLRALVRPEVGARTLEATLASMQVTLGFDAAGFARALDQALATKTAGYMMQLRKAGQTIASGRGGLAIRPPDGTQQWTANVRMHVASVSKLVTAMAMTRALDDAKLTMDSAIAPHLPAYWTRGPNVGLITFRQLLTHRSGFRTGGSGSSFALMRQKVAEGVKSVAEAEGLGEYAYENMNFGLCRILISTITGVIGVNQTYPLVQDQLWDLATIQGYESYVRQRVYAPAGVTAATHDHPAGTALAYTFPPVGAGWDSGDLATMAGGAGWHLTMDELLDTMHHFRRRGTIVTPTRAKEMLDQGLGVDVVSETALGTLYNKNGRWTNNGRTEQSLAYYLPNDMELAVYANSQIDVDAKFFRDVVTQAYLDHIVPELGVGAWVARHGLTGEQYQETFNDLVLNHGMQLVNVSGYGAAGDRYAALWTKSASAPAWQARHALTAAQYQQAFDQLTAQGFTPAQVSGYAAGTSARFACLFTKGDAAPFVARHGLDAAQYQQAFDQFTGQGYALEWISGYRDGSTTRYAAIWRKRATTPAWSARHGLTAAQYQQYFDQMTAQGFMPICLSVSAAGTAASYAVVMRKVAGAPAWVARHGLTTAQYQQAFDQNVGQGFRLRQVAACTVAGQDQFAAIWTK